jgi:hypothetical protein
MVCFFRALQTGLPNSICELDLGVYNPAPCSPLRDSFLHGGDTHDMHGAPLFVLQALILLGLCFGIPYVGRLTCLLCLTYVVYFVWQTTGLPNNLYPQR